MIFKPLDSLAKIVAGQSPESSTYNSTGQGLPFFQGKADFQDMYPTARMWCTSAKRKEAVPNDILISVRAPVGAVNICNQKSIIGRGLAAIRPLAELDGKFLYYYLKANERQIDALGTGSTFKAITQETLKKIEIPVPPLDEQIRIAHLLGKVEGLIAQRKQHLQQLDDLLKSVFLEMFGDPVRNEMGWDKPELKAFGKISTGNTPPRNEPANYDGDFIEWIKTDNITGDAVFVTPATEYLSEIGARRARTVTNGALLVACIAGSVESIGRAALTDRPVSFNQQINAIQPSKDVSPLYLYGLFKLCRAYIQSHATKGMKKILTKGDFEKIAMIKPPFDIQNQFAVIVEKIEGIKSRYQQSLTDLEALYGALSQQAFKGELDLSRITLPQENNMPNVPMEPPVKDEMLPVAFQLPDPPDDSKWLAADNRQRLIEFWLNAWCAHYTAEPFSITAFIDAAYQRLTELAERKAFRFDDPANGLDSGEWYQEPAPFGTDEYEHIKRWVFDALASGRLQQSRNISEHDDKGKPVFGNVIELKAAQA